MFGLKERVGRGHDKVGNPHRVQKAQFEFVEFVFLLSRLDKQLSIEQFEPTVSQSTVSSPLLQQTGAKDPGAKREVGEDR